MLGLKLASCASSVLQESSFAGGKLSEELQGGTCNVYVLSSAVAGCAWQSPELRAWACLEGKANMFG